MRLLSSNQILMSSEENLNSLKNEKQKLKAKIFSVELHLREKESRIQKLEVIFFLI